MATRLHNQNSLVTGQWNTICDVCGFKFKSGDLKKRWDGMMCCKDDWEVRHPLDFVKGVPDDSSVPWTRPDSDVDTAEHVGDEDKFLNIRILGTPILRIQIWDTDLTQERLAILVPTTHTKEGDEFLIYKINDDGFNLTILSQASPDLTTGTADGATSGTTLVDTSEDFDALGVKVNDYIANTTQNFQSKVVSVAGDTIVTSTGDGNWILGNNYQIKARSELVSLAVPYTAVVRYNGTDWNLISYTPLGL